MPRKPLCAALMLLALLASPAVSGTARGEVPFYPGPDLVACPGRPVALAAGDFTGDHVLDVVAAASALGAIALLEGTGDGLLLAGRAFVVGGQPVELAVADLNRDGDPDVVWVDGRDGSVGWMLGTPDGPQLFSSVRTRPGEDEAVGLAVLDLQPDGWPDVVTANRGADQLTVYRNMAGSLEPDGSIPVGDAPAVVRGVWWPGASAPTLLVAEEGALSDDVGVYGGVGPQLRQVLAAPGAGDLQLDEWNGDAWPDLIALESRTGAVSVWTGSPAGELALATRFPVPADAGSLARLPGGGDLRRLVIADGAHNRVALYRGPAGGPIQLADAYFVGSDLRGLLLADLDGDGTPEVIAALGEENSVAVLRRTPQGLQAYPSALTGTVPAALDLLEPEGTRPYRLAVLCAGSSDVRICDLVDRRWHEVDQLPAPTGATGVEWIRLDGDALPDLMIARREVDVTIVPATSGGWGAPLTIPVSSTVRDIAAGDVDGDGDVDLVLGDVQAVALRVLLGDGAGHFVETEAVPLQGPPEECAVHDLDLDGRADVLALDSFRSLYIAFSDPGSFSAPLRFDVGDEPRAIAFGELNGDGLPDVVCANSGESTFTEIVSNSPRFYALGARHVKSPVGASALAVLDVDGNGVDDVVVSGLAAHDVALHLNAGSNTFSVPITFRCTSLVLGLAGADFDGDARGDVVVLDGLGNALVTLLTASSEGVPAAEFALLARRAAAGVELSARSPVPVTARRVRDGATISLLRDAGADAVGQGATWRGVDPTAGAGAELYLLVEPGGAVVAQAQAAPREASTVGARLELLAPSPNPSAGSVALRVRSPARPPLVAVHDLRGRRVRELSLERQQDGWYVARWDGTDARGLAVGAGRYFVVARAGGQIATAAITRKIP